MKKLTVIGLTLEILFSLISPQKLFAQGLLNDVTNLLPVGKNASQDTTSQKQNTNQDQSSSSTSDQHNQKTDSPQQSSSQPVIQQNGNTVTVLLPPLPIVVNSAANTVEHALQTAAQNRQSDQNQAPQPNIPDPAQETTPASSSAKIIVPLHTNESTPNPPEYTASSTRTGNTVIRPPILSLFNGPPENYYQSDSLSPLISNILTTFSLLLFITGVFFIKLSSFQEMFDRKEMTLEKDSYSYL